MRWILTLIVVCVMIGGPALAGDMVSTANKSNAGSAVAPAHEHQSLNNVIKMDAKGKRTALCCCGAEFTVTESAPTLDHSGTLFYMCGEGCKEMALKSTPEETAKTMAAWQTKYDAVKLPTNAKMKDGQLTAVCGCGAVFPVTASSPVIIENGLKAYCCSETCHAAMLKMSAADRITTEKKMLASAAPKGSY